MNIKHFESTTAIEHALIKLDKAIIVLDHWTQEYYYSEKPDPRAAIAGGSEAARGPHYDQSAQWYSEYNYIVQFINIVSDYVYSTREDLISALENAQ